MSKSNRSNKKQFKNSTAYKIIVAILLILYIGFQIWGKSREAQEVSGDSVEASVETQMIETDREAVSEEQESEERESVESEEVIVGEEAENTEESEAAVAAITYTFRYDSLWESHYDKHGIDMGFADKEAYLAAANAVIANPDTLHKIEGEDGDDVYYLEETNEFVVVSTDGYLRTYFLPDDGIDYYNRQ